MIFQRSEIRRKLEKIQQDQLRSLNTSSGSLIPSDHIFLIILSTRYFKRAGIWKFSTFLPSVRISGKFTNFP